MPLSSVVKVCVIGDNDRRLSIMNKLVRNEERLISDDLSDVYRKSVEREGKEVTLMIWNVKKVNKNVPVACRVVVFASSRDRRKHIHTFQEYGSLFQTYEYDDSADTLSDILQLLL